MSKRKGWKTQRDVWNAITRDIAAAAVPAQLPVYGCAEPPTMLHWPDRAKARKDAEKERLRELVRAALKETQ